MNDQADDRVDSLYRLRLEEFVAARDALAKELRAAGERERAAAVKKLAKPSVGAWVVNQLWARHPEELGALIEAGDRLRGAQQDGSGFAEAIEKRRRCLAQLMEMAAAILEEGGHGTSRANLQRVSHTLEALSVLQAHEVPESPGRLSTDLKPPGFEAFGGVAAAADEQAAAAAAEESEREEQKRLRADRKAALKAARRRLAEVKDQRLTWLRKARSAARRLAKAEREQEKARERARRAEEALAGAKQQANEAEWALAQAEGELAEAQQRVEELRK